MLPPWLPRASKVCFRASENESLVVQWASEISLSGLVSDHLQSKTISKDCKMSKTMSQKHVVNKIWTLCAYWASNILVRATENWNVLAHWATGFQ